MQLRSPPTRISPRAAGARATPRRLLPKVIVLAATHLQWPANAGGASFVVSAIEFSKFNHVVGIALHFQLDIVSLRPGSSAAIYAVCKYGSLVLEQSRES